MNLLFDHLVAVAPPDALVGSAVRFLREPAKQDGNEYRGLGAFGWTPADTLRTIEATWRRICTDDLLDQWRWVQDNGGPAQIARRRHLHGVRLAGVPMIRPVVCATAPANGGGRLEELTGVLALPVDVDVAERRPGDRRRYCPTIEDGVAFLRRYAPTVILDAGGGLNAVFVFDRPAEPHAARRLGRDLVAAVARGAAARGWTFDSPPAHAAWIKAPGCVDLFYGRMVTQIAAGATWRFDDLRAAVPVSSGRPIASFNYDRREA